MTGDLNATSGHCPNKKGGEAATSPLNPEPRTLNQIKAKQKGSTIYMIDPF